MLCWLTPSDSPAKAWSVHRCFIAGHPFNASRDQYVEPRRQITENFFVVTTCLSFVEPEFDAKCKSVLVSCSELN